VSETDELAWDQTGPTFLEWSRLLRKPLAGRLEVGHLAYEAFLLSRSETYSLSIGEYVFWGIPIVIRGGFPPECWRLLDTEDNVMKEGSV
jgi:hypothetical protein